MLEKIGAVAYKLQLPESAPIHPVFHVSLLKKAIGDYRVEKDLPNNLEGDTATVQEPETVLAARTIEKWGDLVSQLLVQWKGKAVEEATWEE